MSQAQEMCATTQFPPAIAVTWLNGLGSRLILMPIVLAFDCSCVISDAIQSVPVAHGMVELSACPCLTPGPHSAGWTQVVVPLGTTCQPWLLSSSLALAGLYGNGSPCWPFGDRYWVDG